MSEGDRMYRTNPPAVGLRDRLARRAAQRRAEQIEERRWAMVEPPFQERVVAARARVVAPGELTQVDANPPRRATVASVFLTTKTFVVAVDPPFSAAQAGVMRTRIAEIQRLMIAPNGTLMVVGHGEGNESARTILSLYPDPTSQQLIAELRLRWEASTGQEIEGRRGLTSWFADDRFPIGLWHGKREPRMSMSR